jgi:hypothetical protein
MRTPVALIPTLVFCSRRYSRLIGGHLLQPAGLRFRGAHQLQTLLADLERSQDLS